MSGATPGVVTEHIVFGSANVSPKRITGLENLALIDDTSTSGGLFTVNERYGLSFLPCDRPATNQKRTGFSFQVDAMAVLVVPSARGVASQIRTSIWAGTVQADTPPSNVGSALAQSATQTVNSSDNVARYANFTWLAGPVILAPGTYTARIEHVALGLASYVYSGQCSGVDPSHRGRLGLADWSVRYVLGNSGLGICWLLHRACCSGPDRIYLFGPVLRCGPLRIGDVWGWQSGPTSL
jgi:hypothetical protein